jgi:hypothetical protein
MLVATTRSPDAHLGGQVPSPTSVQSVKGFLVRAGCFPPGSEGNQQKNDTFQRVMPSLLFLDVEDSLPGYFVSA